MHSVPLSIYIFNKFNVSHIMLGQCVGIEISKFQSEEIDLQ